MKLTHYIYYIAAIALLATSCKEDVALPTYTVGEEDNPIVLQAGVGPGRSAQTRAGSEDNHGTATNGGGHKLLDTGIKLRLQVSGTWKGHSPSDIQKVTTASIGADVSVNTHKNVTFTPSEQLYWDDYGTADPNNMHTSKGGNVSDGTDGRSKGLTIYGAAFNDPTTEAPTITTWNGEQSVSVDADQTGGWTKKDFIISNNVCETGADGTYKFDERASGKLLEFRHVMSQVTVNLTAGDGFDGGKFVNEPTVILHGFPTSGNVIVTTGAVSDAGTVTDVTTYRDTPKSWTSTGSVKRTAIVFPTRDISSIGTGADDYIAKITADGNIYYVTKDNLLTAMGSETVMKSGMNYILNVTVNKTKIEVTATVVDWYDAAEANELPIIDFSQCYGHEGTNFAKGFDLYRSTSKTGSYLGTGDHSVVSYTDSKYTQDPQLYWPNHNTHYFFRGIWPIVGSVDASSNPVGPTSGQVKENSIVVSNSAYATGKYPSELMIGMPRKDDGSPDEHCKGSHDVDGICATDGGNVENKGLIRMNFQYAMSQVIVKLETSTGDAAVTFDANTKVEILNIYNDGEIKLSDGSSDFAGKTPGIHPMANDNSITNPETNSYANYRSAIIPQSLSNTTDDLKFRITLGSGSSEDVYETKLGIKNISVVEGSNPAGLIDEWKPGKVYIYTLTLNKTDIQVTATIKDWIPVTASDNIWF